jgi:hypothetical protein
VTFCSENLTSRIKEWTVLDVENLSEHQYICFNGRTDCKYKKGSNNGKRLESHQGGNGSAQ